ncbi:MAG TPA: immunoglobulin domain-containing protein, partial [Clostridia bacterium]|nr:immunoglobulin domain-containing protein [Clostridia bacterium]
MTAIWRSGLGVLIALTISLFSGYSTAAAVYTLTVQTNGAGLVNRNPIYDAYPEGAVVTLTAVPDAGWGFSSWTGDATGQANPLNVSMDQNKVITANFELLPVYQLSLVTNGLGSIVMDPPGGAYISNSVVSLTATPAAGWLFLNWSGDAQGTANPLAITMNGNKAVSGVFVQLPLVEEALQDVTAELGGKVTFSVRAAGTPPLFYQWSFNGSTLAGATDTTLLRSNLQPTQEGTYSVVVSNAYGVASSSAKLTLNDGCS